MNRQQLLRFKAGRQILLCLSIATTLHLFRSSIHGFTAHESNQLYPEDLYRTLRTYTKVLHVVETNYAEPVHIQKAIANSIQRMLNVLDPHCNFYDQKAFKKLQDHQEGNYSGIGVRVAVVEERLMVLSTTAGSPASKFGLRVGDVISSINGVSTAKNSTTKTFELLRGPRHSAVQVSIERPGVNKPILFKIFRGEISKPSVGLCYVIRPKIVYLKLDAFTGTTETEISAVLDPFAHDLEGLILDLRNNSGGDLQAAISLADRFLELNDSILISEGRLANAKSEYIVNRGHQGWLFPLVVLINQRTASAAEIVAGAIQDHQRGLVVGEKSFGKGLIQTVFPLRGGHGLSLTTSKWFTPNGRMIQRDYKNRSLGLYWHLFKTGPGLEWDIKSSLEGLDYPSPSSRKGGIIPDIEVEPERFTPLQIQLLSRHLLFAFAREIKARYPAIARTAVVHHLLIAELRDYLAKRNYHLSDQEFQENLPFLIRNLQSDILLLSVKQRESRTVLLNEDPQIIQALALLPQASLLLPLKNNLGQGDNFYYE